MIVDEPVAEHERRGLRAAFRHRVRTSGTWTSGVFFAIALLAVLPVAVFGVATVQLTSNAVRGQVDTQIQASALASANVVEQQVGRLADAVRAQSEGPRFRSALDGGDVAAIRPSLSSLVEDRDDVQIAFVVDPEGRVVDVLPENPDLIGEDFSFRDWFRGVSSSGGQTYVSEAFEAATSGRPLVFVAVTPVTSPTDPTTTTGYVGVAQTLESMQSFVDDFAASQDVSLTITDQAGTIVSTPGDAPTAIVKFDEIVTSSSGGISAVSESTHATVSGCSPPPQPCRHSSGA